MSFAHISTTARTKGLRAAGRFGWLALALMLMFSLMPGARVQADPGDEAPSTEPLDSPIAAQGVFLSDDPDSLQPAAAFDTGGNLHVVWHDASGAARYAKGIFAGSGYSWQGPFDIARYPGSAYVYPRITVDRQDRVHAVWMQSADGPIQYRSWAASQTPQQGTAPVQLGTGLYPTVATGPNNTVSVTWSSKAATGNYDIYYRESSGSEFTPAQNVSENAGDSLRPDIAVDSNNIPHIVWSDKTPEGVKIRFARRVDGQWQAQNISDPFSYNPSIFADQAGCVHLAWVTSPSSVGTAWYRKACNGVFAPGIELGAVTGVARAAVGATAQGRAVVTWSYNAPGAHTIHYSVIRPDGSFTTARTLEPSGTTQLHSDVAVSATGRAAVVWQQASGGQFDPAASALNICTAGSATAESGQAEVTLSAATYTVYLPLIQRLEAPAC